MVADAAVSCQQALFGGETLARRDVNNNKCSASVSHLILIFAKTFNLVHVVRASAPCGLGMRLAACQGCGHNNLGFTRLLLRMASQRRRLFRLNR